MRIKPLFDRVLIKQIDKIETNTSFALVIPESIKEKPLVAEVLAVGDGEDRDGKKVPMQVKVNDKILFSKYAGSEFKIDGREVIIIRQTDILAVLIDETKDNKEIK